MMGLHALRHAFVVSAISSAAFVLASAKEVADEMILNKNTTHPYPKKTSKYGLRGAGQSTRKLTHHTAYINDECSSFCSLFMEWCPNGNLWLTPYEPTYDGCMEACFQYPRTKVKNPPEGPLPPSGPDLQGGNVAEFTALGQDTFACRQTHLALASPDRLVNSGSAGQSFHCYHASPLAGAICIDSFIDGKTPYEHMRDGMGTYRHYGYCDLMADDTVADCTYAPINDDLLPDVLALLPGTVQYLFLQEIPGITYLDFTTLANLRNPENLRALYLDGCALSRLDARVFEPVKNLEILSMNNNQLVQIPKGTLWCLTQLRHFSAFVNRFDSDYFEADMFRDKPLLEKMIMYGNPDITGFPAGFADGLTNLEIFSFVNSGLRNEGIPDGLWDDLVNLEWFDFFGNYFTSIPSRWFGQWSHNIKRFSFDSNYVSEVEWELFQDLPGVEQVFLHYNDGIRTVPDGTFANNPNLVHLALGPRPEDLMRDRVLLN